MKHYHFLIMADGELNRHTKFFKVGIGTSMQANRDYLFLLSLATRHNYYFELVSVETTQFINQCAQSLFDGCSGDPLDYIDYSIIDARDLVRQIKAGATCQQNYIDKARSRALCYLNQNYRITRNLSNM